MRIDTFHFRGRPVLALSRGTPYWLRLGLIIKFYPQNTWRRLIFKALILGALAFGGYRVIFREIGESLSRAVSDLKPGECENVLIRFHTVTSKSRCYCFFSTKELELCAFGKLGFNSDSRNLLSKELRKLQILQSNSVVKVPSIVNVINHEHVGGFALTPIPDGYRLHAKPRGGAIDSCLLKELQGEITLTPICKLQSQGWWSVFESLIQEDLEEQSLSLYVSRLHGDIGSENIFESANAVGFYLVDWEQASLRGPYLTDALAYWLGSYHKQILGRADASWLHKKFYSEFMAFYGCREVDACAALAYLVSVEFDLANALSVAHLERRL